MMSVEEKIERLIRRIEGLELQIDEIKNSTTKINDKLSNIESSSTPDISLRDYSIIDLNGLSSKLPDAFGAYFWAGYDVPNALVPGLIRLQQAGFASTARIRLTPAVRAQSATDREYRFDTRWEAEVPAEVPFLPAAVRSTQYQQAFALQGLQTFVFTAYDSASMNHLIDSVWLDSNAELVRSEYRDRTVALYETQNGTGKRFIVCN